MDRSMGRTLADFPEVGIGTNVERGVGHGVGGEGALLQIVLRQDFKFAPGFEHITHALFVLKIDPALRENG